MRMLRDLTLNTTVTNDTIISPSVANNVNAITKTTNVWKSPIPYLFGSLAMMLLLITVALVLLVFAYRKTANLRRGGNDDDDDQKPATMKSIEAVHLEPKVVVIMAGDDRPTYLATPSLTISMPTVNVCSCDHSKSCDDQQDN